MKTRDRMKTRQKEAYLIRANQRLPLWVRLILWFGALIILGFVITAIVTKHSPRKPKEITNGFITRIWMELPRHDVRLRSPGVWEQAWLDTMYFMELHNPDHPGKQKFRTVEIHKSMYYNGENVVGEWKELGDSAKYAADREKALQEEAEWGKNKFGKQKPTK